MSTESQSPPTRPRHTKHDPILDEFLTRLQRRLKTDYAALLARRLACDHTSDADAAQIHTDCRRAERQLDEVVRLIAEHGRHHSVTETPPSKRPK